MSFRNDVGLPQHGRKIQLRWLQLLADCVCTVISDVSRGKTIEVVSIGLGQTPETARINIMRTAVTWGTFFVLAAIGVLTVTAHFRSRDIAGSNSYALFCRDVAPILAENCSAKDERGNFICHGRQAGRIARNVDEVTGGSARIPHLLPATASACDLCHTRRGQMRFSFAIDSSGKIGTDRQRLLAFEQVKSVASKLIRMPLSAQSGGMGLFHPGGEVFDNAADPQFQKLANWVALEKSLNTQKQSTPGEAELFFQKEILPVLARRTCMAPACHTFNHSSFVPDAGTASADLNQSITDHFTAEQVKYNRATAKGLIQPLVYLTGDVAQSRFLKKIIPIEEGGILHRGGNDQFIQGHQDPDYKKMKQWLLLERQEATSKLCSEGKPLRSSLFGVVRGIVFLRTPVNNSRKYLDVGKFLPGADLYLLKLNQVETPETAHGKPYNLTARFHPGTQADIRKPVVRYDGKAIMFAMRRGKEDNLNIYELKLDDDLNYKEGSLRRLTWGPRTVNGMPVHYSDPLYVPDPTDVNADEGGYNLDRVDVVFTSNLSGRMVQSSERGTIGQADGGDQTTILDYDRPEPAGYFAGKRIYIVDGKNRGEWRTIKAFRHYLSVSSITVDRPFSAPVDKSTVYVIERPANAQPDFLPGYSVYGIKYAGSGDERSTYEQTITRITWNLGQDMDLSVRTTGEVFFGSQRAAVDRFDRPVFHMASCRRHLDTRFSFPTHHGNRSHIPIYASNIELPYGIDIHVGMDEDNLWQGGNLIVSDHQFGPDLEPKNPNLFSYGVFDDHGVPITDGQDILNTRFDFKKRPPSHPRFVFKTIPLFNTHGPEAVTWTGMSPGGIFRDPALLPDGNVLVSYCARPVNHLDPRANPDFDLYVLKGNPSLTPPGGKGFPNISLTRVAAASQPGMAEVEAVPVFVRMKEKINAGKRPRSEHLIRYPGSKPDLRPAAYLERNYLLIDAIMRDPSPYGKRVAYPRDPVTGAHLKSIDAVKGVRFVEALPVVPELAGPLDLNSILNHDPQSTLISNGISPIKRIIGEARLEKDGSVYCRIPSNTPIVLQSINEDGMALRQEARYYFFAPNETFSISPSASETFRTCGACMGALTGQPQELFGPILPFSGQAAVEAISHAGDQPPALGLDPNKRFCIDFNRDIQPVFDKHCTCCHGEDSPAAGLSLVGTKTRYYSKSYESLMQLQEPASGWYGRKKYVDEREALAIKSYLVAKLYGRQLKAEQLLSGDKPHPSAEIFTRSRLPAAPLTEHERKLIALWIDLGATYRGN